MKGKDSGEAKGYAFITFKNKELASKAIEELNNSQLKVISTSGQVSSPNICYYMNCGLCLVDIHPLSFMLRLLDLLLESFFMFTLDF